MNRFKKIFIQLSAFLALNAIALCSERVFGKRVAFLLYLLLAICVVLRFCLISAA